MTEVVVPIRSQSFERPVLQTRAAIVSRGQRTITTIVNDFPSIRNYFYIINHQVDPNNTKHIEKMRLKLQEQVLSLQSCLELIFTKEKSLKMRESEMKLTLNEETKKNKIQSANLGNGKIKYVDQMMQQLSKLKVEKNVKILKMVKVDEYSNYAERSLKLLNKYKILIQNLMEIANIIQHKHPTSELIIRANLINQEISAKTPTFAIDNKMRSINNKISYLTNHHNKNRRKERYSHIINRINSINNISSFLAIPKLDSFSEGGSIQPENEAKTPSPKENKKGTPLYNYNKLSQVVQKVFQSCEEHYNEAFDFIEDDGLIEFHKMIKNSYSQFYYGELLKTIQLVKFDAKNCGEAIVKLCQNYIEMNKFDQRKYPNALRYLFYLFARYIFSQIYTESFHITIILENKAFPNSIYQLRKRCPKDFTLSTKFLPLNLHSTPISQFPEKHLYSNCVDDILYLQFESDPLNFCYSSYKVLNKIQNLAASFMSNAKDRSQQDCQLSLDELLDITTVIVLLAAPLELNRIIRVFAPFVSGLKLFSQLEFAFMSLQTVCTNISSFVEETN